MRKSRPAHFIFQSVVFMVKKLELAKHMLIPKHSKLSDKDKAELLKRYGIELTSLPRIFKTDAAIDSLSAKPSDVIKIVRKSPTAGVSVFYRVVVDA